METELSSITMTLTVSKTILPYMLESMQNFPILFHSFFCTAQILPSQQR